MRSVILVATTFTFATIAFFACSDDTPAVTDDQDSGTGSSTSSSSSSSSSGETSSSSTSSSGSTTSSSGDGGGSSGDGGGTSSGSTYDGGGSVDGGDAGTLCLAASTPESEDNNTEGTADVLPNMTNSFCGRISAAGDVDYATFTWQEGKTSSGWHTFYSSSAITVEITADGMPVTFNSPPKPGKVYVLKITAAAATDYRVEVEMK